MSLIEMIDEEELAEASEYAKSEDFFEDMAKNYPELMEKSRIDSFGVGSGWHTIIAALCRGIHAPFRQAQDNLRWARESGNDNNILELELNLAEVLEELPTIYDVKEKFGTMRFHIYGGTAVTHALVDFAEELSEHVCEVCGDKGEIDTYGWHKTHCKKHFRQPQDNK